MTAKEFLEHDNNIWKKIDDNNLTKAALIEFAQTYHESEVKNLGLFNVSNRRELLIAFAQFIEEEYWDNKGINDSVDTFIRTKGN